MKRFLLMIVAVCAFVAASAQHPMVTLSRNGELKFFSNLTALNTAVDSAQNGDVLYLSEGAFVTSGGALTLTKRLSIVGNGYGSYIIGDINIDMTNNPNSSMDAPLFDGVKLDKLAFANSKTSHDNLKQSEIRRCWIRELVNGAIAGNDVTFDKCYIKKASFDGSGSVVVRNSKVNATSSLSNVTAINSHISSSSSFYPLTTISCIFSPSSKPSAASGKVSIINSLLDFTPSTSDVYTENCYIYSDETQALLDDDLNCPLNLTELGYLGQDGTVVGIYGGEYPFSESPSVPSVDTANSSVEYDAAGNKLKVSITVKAD